MHISGEILLIFTSEKQTLIVQYRSQNCHINVGFEEVNLSTIFLIKVLHSIEYFHFAQQTVCSPKTTNKKSADNIINMSTTRSRELFERKNVFA